MSALARPNLTPHEPLLCRLSSSRGPLQLGSCVYSLVVCSCDWYVCQVYLPSTLILSQSWSHGNLWRRVGGGEHRRWRPRYQPPCAARDPTSCCSTSTTPALATGPGTCTALPSTPPLTVASTRRTRPLWCAHPLACLRALPPTDLLLCGSSRAASAHPAIPPCHPTLPPRTAVGSLPPTRHHPPLSLLGAAGAWPAADRLPRGLLGVHALPRRAHDRQARAAHRLTLSLTLNPHPHPNTGPISQHLP